VQAYVHVKKLDDAEYVENNFIVLCTKKGTIKKTKLEAYSRPRSSGIIAIGINEGDELIEAKLTGGQHEVIIANKGGMAIRFNESKVRPMGRGASGVRGIRLVDDVSGGVVGMVCVENESEDILVVSEHGYGKRSKIEDYRITNRGGKGVKTMNITEKTGKLVSVKGVIDTDDLMIITKSGLTIRTPMTSIRLQGRATQGVRLINLRDGDAIASVTYIEAGKGLEDEMNLEINGEIPPADTLPADDNGTGSESSGKDFETEK
jgi:DNA gyrase subunit A